MMWEWRSEDPTTCGIPYGLQELTSLSLAANTFTHGAVSLALSYVCALFVCVCVPVCDAEARGGHQLSSIFSLVFWLGWWSVSQDNPPDSSPTPPTAGMTGMWPRLAFLHGCWGS